jgi:hypothetical protein
VQPQTIIASMSHYVLAIAPMLQADRDPSVGSGTVAGLETIVLAPSLVMAVIDWGIIASSGDLLYSHQASYTLVRIDGRRIAAIALDELPKLRAALQNENCWIELPSPRPSSFTTPSGSTMVTATL